MRTTILILGYLLIQMVGSHFGIKVNLPENIVLMLVGLFTSIPCDFVAVNQKQATKKAD